MADGTIFMSGDKDCSSCGGRGVVRVNEHGSLTPVVEPCECVIVKRVMTNVERGWKGLLNAPRIDESRLLEAAEDKDNLWVTANHMTLKAHLRHVALRMGPHWGFQVVTDADLMIAWLASAKMEGMKILDPEVAAHAAPVSSTKVSLPDLIKPPEVLVIVLGVKAARNSAMPEVLCEALNHRFHDQKPVWIIDQPQQRLATGHRAFDLELSGLLDQMTYLKLETLSGVKDGNKLVDPEQLIESPSQRGRIGLSTGFGRASTNKVESQQDARKGNKKRGGKR